MALDRATVRQRKTGHPVRLDLTEQTREAIDGYIKVAGKRPGDFLFPSRRFPGRSLTTRQYARLVSAWIASIKHRFGCQFLWHQFPEENEGYAHLSAHRQATSGTVLAFLLGHRKIESTVRYLGIEVDDALAIAEQVDV